MDCPIEIPVYDNDRTAGKLQIRREGLYYVFSCRMEMQSSRILRLYAINGLHVLPVSVLMPTKEGLHLEHKISVQTWPLSNVDTAICGFSPEPGFLPWRGEVEGTAVCGWIKEDEEGFLLAVDVSRDPFPLIESLPDAEQRSLSGIECMCLRLDPAGKLLRRTEQEQEPEETDESE